MNQLVNTNYLPKGIHALFLIEFLSDPAGCKVYDPVNGTISESNNDSHNGRHKRQQEYNQSQRQERNVFGQYLNIATLFQAHFDRLRHKIGHKVSQQ